MKLTTTPVLPRDFARPTPRAAPTQWFDSIAGFLYFGSYLASPPSSFAPIHDPSSPCWTNPSLQSRIRPRHAVDAAVVPAQPGVIFRASGAI